MGNSELIKRRLDCVARGVGIATTIFADKAKNTEIWDCEGRRYIDFSSGIAVLNTGHCHPKVIDAVKKQLERFTHTCHQVVPYENYIELAEKLNKVTPGNFKKKTIFLTTGAEAVENAVKIARAYTGRDGIIAFSGGFHGRTFMGMALTGKVAPYKVGFGAMPSDIYHIPYPYSVHGVTTKDSINALNNLFKADIDPNRIAAIILEPVQGEGGFYQAPAELMNHIREICDKHGIVMIADEVQTGFARTGKLFAMDHYDVAPDLITMAKSLAGGFPLSAVTGKAEIMDAPNIGGLGGTYGGNPLAIAASLAVLNVIEEEKLCEKASQLGSHLRQRLASIQDDIPEIKDIRGPGFMIAVEFFDENGNPSANFANNIRIKALEKGLILLTCGIYNNVIRFLAPITIEDNIFNEALDILEQSLREVKGES